MLINRTNFLETNLPVENSPLNFQTAKRAKTTRYEIADDWVDLIKADEVNGPTWKEILEKVICESLHCNFQRLLLPKVPG